MLRFSPGFYVGSMKNVPPALLAGNTTTTTTITITTILASVLTFHVFRENPSCQCAPKRRPSPQENGFNWFRTSGAWTRSPTHAHREIAFSSAFASRNSMRFLTRPVAASDLNSRYRHATDKRAASVSKRL